MKTFYQILNESTMNEAYIDLDWALEGDPAKDKYVKKAKLKTELMDDSTGFPEYRFTGKRSDIERYLIVYNGGDKEEAEWMKDQIVGK